MSDTEKDQTPSRNWEDDDDSSPTRGDLASSSLLGDNMGPSSSSPPSTNPTSTNDVSRDAGSPMDADKAAEFLEKLTLLTDRLRSIQAANPAAKKAENGSGEQGQEDEDEDDVDKRDGRENGEKVRGGAAGVVGKKEADALAIRGQWNWDRTEEALVRCLATGTKGVLPTKSNGKESARITDVS
jgi:hypothetical protein